MNLFLSVSKKALPTSTVLPYHEIKIYMYFVHIHNELNEGNDKFINFLCIVKDSYCKGGGGVTQKISEQIYFNMQQDLNYKPSGTAKATRNNLNEQMPRPSLLMIDSFYSDSIVFFDKLIWHNH